VARTIERVSYPREISLVADISSAKHAVMHSDVFGEVSRSHSRPFRMKGGSYVCKEQVLHLALACGIAKSTLWKERPGVDLSVEVVSQG